MNRLSRLLVTAYILVSAYLLLSFIYGSSGIFSSKELKVYNNHLIENINQLKSNNRELEKKLELLKNIENVRLKAREIGYVAASERKIHLTGMENPAFFHTLGKIIYFNIPENNNRLVIRSLSLIIALLFYILSSIFISVNNGNKKNR